jgi:hypothetical protein
MLWSKYFPKDFQMDLSITQVKNLHFVAPKFDAKCALYFTQYELANALV